MLRFFAAFAFIPFGFVSSVQFSFIPSPNITILQSAVYQCIVDGAGPSDTLPVQWFINATGSFSPSWNSYTNNYSIVFNGSAFNSTLTIPGNTALNGTTVQCIIVGIVNGNRTYVNNGSDTLYIQGKPAGVGLYCTLLSLYTIKCNWSIPYTLHGVDITGYDINITNGTSNNLIMNTTVNETEYTYNVSKCGVYNISVAADIGDGLKGDISTDKLNIEVEVSESINNITNWTIELFYNNECLIVHCKIYNQLEQPLLFIMEATSLPKYDISYSYNTTNISNSKNFLSAYLAITERNVFSTSLKLEYENNIQIHSINNHQISKENNFFSKQPMVNMSFPSHTIGTFRVRNVSIIENGLSDGYVCFQCVFASFVSISRGCFIKLTCTDVFFEQSLKITKIECQNNIKTCTYNISAYDIKRDGTIYSIKPAYHTSRQIIGIQLTSPISLSHSASITSSIEPTISLSSESNMLVVIATTVGTVIFTVSMVFIILCIIVTFLLKRAKQEKYSHTKIHFSSKQREQAAIQMCYVETEFDSNRPRAPASTSDNMTFPYVSVQLQNEEYSRLSHYPRPHRSFMNNTENAEDSDNHCDNHYSSIIGKSYGDDKELTYNFLVNNIVSKIPHKWKEFGEQLAIIPPILEEIQNNHPNSDRSKFCDVVHEWQSSKTTKKFSWETLNVVLNSIGENSIVTDIQPDAVQKIIHTDYY